MLCVTSSSWIKAEHPDSANIITELAMELGKIFKSSDTRNIGPLPLIKTPFRTFFPRPSEPKGVLFGGFPQVQLRFSRVRSVFVTRITHKKLTWWFSIINIHEQLIAHWFTWIHGTQQHLFARRAAPNIICSMS
jgi:hypothetical protein